MGVFADSEMHKTKICIKKASKKSSSTNTVATSCSFLLWWEKKRGLYFVSGGQICSTSLKKTFPAQRPSPAGIPSGWLGAGPWFPHPPAAPQAWWLSPQESQRVPDPLGGQGEHAGQRKPRSYPGPLRQKENLRSMLKTWVQCRIHFCGQEKRGYLHAGDCLLLSVRPGRSIWTPDSGLTLLRDHKTISGCIFTPLRKIPSKCWSFAWGMQN